MPLKTNADESYSSLSWAHKREKLNDLMERRKGGKRPVPKERDATNVKSYNKESLKRKKLNAHFYKKLFQIRKKKAKLSNDVYDNVDVGSCSSSKRKKHRKKVKVWNHVNDTLTAESCSRKKPRLCYGQALGESVHQSVTKDKIQSGSSEEVSTETHNHILPFVNKLRDHRNRGQNAVIFGGQERVVKVVSFVSSLLDNTKKPILIVAASSSVVSLWETEFSKWSKSVNAVTYKGDKDIRAAIRGLKFQVLISSLDAIVKDMEMLDHIKWEMLVIDECQCSIFSTHLKKIQMIITDMKLLTVTGESEDIMQSYRNILLLVDRKNEKIHTDDADMETNDDINTLKARLSPFIAFECTLSTPDLEEYLVPVHLSSMQIEQYCSILASNSDTLSSSRKSPPRDILTQIQKCCDHPFLADSTLRNSSKEGSLIDDDPLAAEINVSGKLQVLDKLLLDVKRCGLRALVLFHSSVNSEKISTGHFLDDLVHRRFDENLYIHIPVNTLNSAHIKKKESLEKFNNADSECFICLCDYRACHSSIRLSRLDVVILFNSDYNPSTDIRALKRITIDPHRERLNIFRLYSPFTVEEKALILSKQGTPVDHRFRWRVCHRLLGWGAPYLFSKLQSCTDTRPQSFIDDLVHEMSFLLRNSRVKPGPTKRSMISRVVTPAESILLFGETENLTKESSFIDDYLIDNRHSVFWNKLVKESQPGPKKSCNTRRVQKSSRNWIKDVNATSPSFVRSKPRSKRKLVKNAGRKWGGAHAPFGTHQACETATPSTALNPGTNEGQQSQTDQPPPHTLDTEIERIQKEREKVAKSHEEKESTLLAECEKEILKVRKKYDGLIHDSKTRSTNEDIVLEEYEKLVNANKLLAEILAQHWQDTPVLKKTQKETSAVKILQIPTYVPVRPKNLCLTSGPLVPQHIHLDAVKRGQEYALQPLVNHRSTNQTVDFFKYID